LNDLEQMLTQAEELQAGPYMGIGKIMKAYMYSIMVDMWGDIPFSGAQQGAENLFPAFDSGQEVYNSLFALIDEGISDLSIESSFTPGSDDLIYGGDLDKWERFGKTLKLKMYTQVRLAQDVSEEVRKLIEEDDLIGPDDDFQMQYGTSSAPDNRNPAYAQEYAQGGAFNYISPYFFEVMKGINTFFDDNIYKGIVDPRIPYYFYNQLPEGATDADAENPCSYCPSRSGTSFLS
ncbi:MAG: SusD/RagB family nutrient-binding outer membrane lipoprotein, partial [Phaeodactylibacter sp.]|nr:SusD/RagB family nutrient-binding outer membrane lipoprotein [Phaeodactylibacter sp.]